MKDIWNKLKTPPRLNKWDVLWTLLPLFLWFMALQSRPHVMDLYCSKQPELCTPESIFLPDRLAYGHEFEDADRLSFAAQCIAGGFSFFVPFLWSSGALVQLGTDLVLILQTVVWNGALNEGAKLLTQRPRPFVYYDPSRLGSDPAHYTSFYSGHTSFAAASTLGAFFVLVGKNISLHVLRAVSLCSFALIFLTGFFRVFAGKHFLTDVLAAGFAGALIAFMVAYFHRKK